MAMKTERQIVFALSESQLSAEEMEHWDGEPDMYVNQGWQEALTWVLGHNSKLLKRYNLKQEEELLKLIKGKKNE